MLYIVVLLVLWISVFLNIDKLTLPLIFLMTVMMAYDHIQLDTLRTKLNKLEQKLGENDVD